MRPRPKIRSGLTLAAMLLVAGYAMGRGPGSARPEGDDGTTDAGKVVARVNGRPLYEAQLKPELEAILQKFRKYGMRREDDAVVRRWRNRILDRLIGEQLIYQESQKLTIENIEERVREKLKALQMKYGAAEHFEKYLESKKLAMKDLRESLRAKVYVAEYLKRQGIAEPEIPEGRIREFYQRNPNAYAREETVKVSHILIRVREHSGAVDKLRARQKAERIRREILDGRDFAELARRHSECNSASGGGDLRYIKRGYMPAEFDEVAFSMEREAVSEVVETRFGFHIIEVFDKKPAGVAPYEEVREFIRKFLQQEESKKKLAAHTAELKGKARIEILLSES